MKLILSDWLIIALYFIVSAAIGLATPFVLRGVAQRAGPYPTGLDQRRNPLCRDGAGPLTADLHFGQLQEIPEMAQLIQAQAAEAPGDAGGDEDGVGLLGPGDGLHVGERLVAVFRLGDQEAGKEGTKRKRKSHLIGGPGDAKANGDDTQEKKFTVAGFCNVV